MSAYFDSLSKFQMRTTVLTYLTCICRRIILLETVAGVPGMVGAMTRHFHSLRRMRRDHGWIHTLLGKSLRMLRTNYFHEYNMYTCLIPDLPGERVTNSEMRKSSAIMCRFGLV